MSRNIQKLTDQMFGTTWKKWICLVIGHSYGRPWVGIDYDVYPCVRCHRKIAKVAGI